MILPFHHYTPQLGERAWIASNATVIGDVRLGADVSVWFGTVIRGDVHRIVIGERTNIQDNSVVHVTHHKGRQRLDSDGHATHIGSEVTIGHRAVIHGCTIGNRCLIGMGAIILDGAEIGPGSIVGAGSLVTKGKRFAANSLILGSPARHIRSLTEEEADSLAASAARYVSFKDQYLHGRQPDTPCP